MTIPSIPTSLQKPLRFFFAYLLFILFAVLGVVLLIQLHSVLVATGTLLSSRYGLARFLNTWGFFFLLGAYVIGIALMENVMNKAAQSGDLLRPGLRIFAIEGGLALICVVVPLLAELFLIPR